MRTLRQERSTVTLTRWLVSLEDVLRDCRRSSAHEQGADPSNPGRAGCVCIEGVTLLWFLSQLYYLISLLMNVVWIWVRDSAYAWCSAKYYIVLTMLGKIQKKLDFQLSLLQHSLLQHSHSFLHFFGECCMVHLSLSIPLFLPMLNLFLSKYLPSFHLVYWAELPSCILRS